MSSEYFVDCEGASSTKKLVSSSESVSTLIRLLPVLKDMYSDSSSIMRDSYSSDSVFVLSNNESAHTSSCEMLYIPFAKVAPGKFLRAVLIIASGIEKQK